MNNYITTAKGFIKSIIFNKETLKYNIEYTTKIREAQRYKTTTALAILKNHKIEGFIYNPWKEEPIRDMYEVVIKKDYSFRSNKEPEYYIYQKAKMCNETDAKYLEKQHLVINKLYTLEQAQEKVNELNKEILTKTMNAIIPEPFSSEWNDLCAKMFGGDINKKQ